MTLMRMTLPAPAAIAMIIRVFELDDYEVEVLLLLVKPVATTVEEMRLKLLELAELMLLLIVL